MRRGFPPKWPEQRRTECTLWRYRPRAIDHTRLTTRRAPYFPSTATPQHRGTSNMSSATSSSSSASAGSNENQTIEPEIQAKVDRYVAHGKQLLDEGQHEAALNELQEAMTLV